MRKAAFEQFLKTLGPGILFASMAIGVSHLVQSTRAGADYGFALLWAILLANLFKYPFFEFSSRYANATGESTLDGYFKLGKWTLYLYGLVSMASMFTVIAAVSFVCSSLLMNLLHWQVSITQTTMVLFFVCLFVLLLGKYKVLDGLIKILGSIMLLSTLLAFLFVLSSGSKEPIEAFEKPQVWDTAGIAFVIALMGWMPTAVDISSWNSLWTVARIKQTGYRPKLKETLLDFNLGYLISAILAVCFMTLGAKLMYGTGIELSNKSTSFAQQIISLYTETLGDWSYFIIAIAAFSIMFSTTISVFDGYARAMERVSVLLFFKQTSSRKIYAAWLFVLLIGGYLIVSEFQNQLKDLVDLATVISFLVAPIVAVLNVQLVRQKGFPKAAKPPKWLLFLSYVGTLFLIGFAMLYIFSR